MADADHFRADMSSIAGNPAKWPFLLRTRELKLFNRHPRHRGRVMVALRTRNYKARPNTLLAYFI
jgi:hypothetical protein